MPDAGEAARNDHVAAGLWTAGRQGAIEPATRPAPPPSTGRTQLPRPARRAARRQPDGRSAAAPGARGRPPRQPPDGPSRGRPAPPPVRRDRRCPGPLPVELRRPGRRPAGRDRVGRWGRPPRPGLRGPPAPARRPGPRGRWPNASPRKPRCSSASASWRSSRPTRAISPTRRRGRRHDPAARAQLRDLPRRAGIAGACQAELELFREVLGADVVREQHIASGDRCCTYRVAEPRRTARSAD